MEFWGLLQLPALLFPRVIIISPFLKTIYNKVPVHLYIFTFVETIFNLKNGLLLIQLTSELHTNILIITRGSYKQSTFGSGWTINMATRRGDSLPRNPILNYNFLSQITNIIIPQGHNYIAFLEDNI
jgi:hypothetical protein